ncbi:MAG TPA: hypothetical protein VKB19_07380 [Pedobacter sp.]|nr:hypothetical protein [Pedobacter sp.]
MRKDKTPTPGSSDYPVNQPQKLNVPKFSSSGRKAGDEVPPVENMNDELTVIDNHNAVDMDQPETNLGNQRDEDEDQQERIISR